MFDRKMTEEDWPQYQAFAKKHFGPFHILDESFNRYWFHTDDTGWNVRILDAGDGSIAGLTSFIKVPARLGEHKTFMHWMISTVAEPEAQEQGMGARLFMWTFRELPLSAAICGNDLSAPLSTALGLDVPGLEIRRFVRILSPACKDIIAEAERAQIMDRFADLPNLGASQLRAQWETALPTDTPALWQAFSQNLKCCVERTPEYLSWRYEKAPYSRYHFLTVRDGDKLVGLGVVRFCTTPAGPAARIVDFMSWPGFDAVVWSALLHACRDRGACYADFFVMGTHQDAYMDEAGLSRASQENKLESVPNLLYPIDHRRWSYTFHLGGTLAREDQSWRDGHLVWFTKGDADRDWPTTKSILDQDT